MSSRVSYGLSDRGLMREGIVKKLERWVEIEKRLSGLTGDGVVVFWGEFVLPVGRTRGCLCTLAVHCKILVQCFPMVRVGL